jgi:S-adenosylmethionine:tRNA ribosyltransferase-isomerase
VSVGLSLDDYDFELPEALIAQRPPPRRADSRLLVWPASADFEHREFARFPALLREGDLLVLNDTKVFPARLFGRKLAGEAGVEILLVRPSTTGWEALVRPGRRLPPGTHVRVDGGAVIEIAAAVGSGLRIVHFPDGFEVFGHCARFGHVPLPPYIRRDDEAADRDRYQTVFAREDGSVAAPTAGLHFDEALLAEIRERGIETAHVTLHVGPGTFRPVADDQLESGELHPEWREVPARTLTALHRCRERGGRVIAVGTTVCRTLESLPADAEGTVRGATRLMIAPGFSFRFTDVLVTNFHLPRSSLLLLVAAFAGERWREAYARAVKQGYRFYSYGDANWIEAGQ